MFRVPPPWSREDRMSMSPESECLCPRSSYVPGVRVPRNVYVPGVPCPRSSPGVRMSMSPESPVPGVPRECLCPRSSSPPSPESPGNVYVPGVRHVPGVRPRSSSPEFLCPRSSGVPPEFHRKIGGDVIKLGAEFGAVILDPDQRG
jgi:hypothetical protein